MALVARTSAGVTSLNLGQDTVTITNGSVTEATRLYAFPGGVTALRDATATANVLHWQAGNSQGTSSTDITADGLAVTRRAFLPYGDARTTTGAGPWPGNYGFVGGRTDPATALTNLGVREYNPALGRFVSVDPILERDDPQAINGYLYSNDDPINKSDPSGAMYLAGDGAPPHTEPVDQGCGSENACTHDNPPDSDGSGGPTGGMGLGGPTPAGQGTAPKDYTTWHNNVVADAISTIRQQAAGMGWHNARLQSEYFITGGSKNCMRNGELDCDYSGRADIVMTALAEDGHRVQFIWEVKSAGVEGSQAYEETGWYQVVMMHNAINAHARGADSIIDIRRGWMIGGPHTGDISGPQTRYWGEYGGVVKYSNVQNDDAQEYIQDHKNDITNDDRASSDNSPRVPGATDASQGASSSSGSSGSDPCGANCSPGAFLGVLPAVLAGVSEAVPVG